jgi:hypothetical protein
MTPNGWFSPRGRLWRALPLPFFVACSSLPDFAAPKSGTVSSDFGEGGDLIRYRALEQSDFKRKDPPGQIRHGQYELGAQTCAHLRTDPNVPIEVVKPAGSKQWEGRLRYLRFYAFMDRECSWWNPKQDDPAYTLQHEQIHFAISEIAARNLNREAVELVKELRVTASTQQEVAKQVEAEVNELLEKHNQAATERNTDFDKDTSLGRNVARQRKWWEDVSRELRETEAWK